MEWYPTPSYLVKRRVILEHLQRWDVGDVLEVGCGCGDLLLQLERRGYTGMGIDISEGALGVARSILTPERITVACCTPEQLDRQFGLVIASEVMEHQQDDRGFLKGLSERLRADGHLVLTVPAHMAHWGPNDDFCGHIRRYSRQELHDKLTETGFDQIEILSYGVPVYNLMKPFYDRAIRRASHQESQRDRTTDSGGMWLLPSAARLFELLFNDVTMLPLYLMQRLFYRSDLGMGYFVAARKKESR